MHIVAALAKQLEDAEYACVREPLIDPDHPATSDVDVLVFDDTDDLIPERRRLAIAGDAPRWLDLLHVPARALADPATVAAWGLVVHRLLTSKPIVVREPSGTAVVRVRALASEAGVQDQRLRGFLDMGAYTIREIGITWDFPELAVLWSTIAQIACVAAMTDAAGGCCPNVYTRPLGYLRALEPRLGLALERDFVVAARLDVDPLAAVAPLERMHTVIAERFPEPLWPATMRAGTRAEYRYFAAADELALRVAAAREMHARGDGFAALFYLRFHAYMLARVPMVARCAREGRNVSFVRPERAVGRVLSEECPEILDDLRTVLGDGTALDSGDVAASVAATLALRATCLGFLRECRHDLGPIPDWEPCRPAPGPIAIGQPTTTTLSAAGG